MPSDQNNNWF